MFTAALSQMTKCPTIEQINILLHIQTIDYYTVVENEGTTATDINIDNPNQCSAK